MEETSFSFLCEVKFRILDKKYFNINKYIMWAKKIANFNVNVKDDWEQFDIV